MRLKAIYHGDNLCLATESGELIESAEGCDVHFKYVEARTGEPITAAFEVTLTGIENAAQVVDADVRALPEPRTALPQTIAFVDYDPDEGPFFYDSEGEEVDSV